MTVFTLFGEQLFVLYTWVGHLGLALATWATAALGFTLRHRAWAELSAAARSRAMSAGLASGVLVALALAVGLRVGGTAYAPAEPMFWQSLTAMVSSLGLALAAYALGSGVAGGWKGLPGVAPAPQLEVDAVEAAVRAYQHLAAAADRLRAAEQEAAARAKAVTDGVAAAEYVKAADAIRHRLQLAEELRASTGSAVLRLVFGAPVRRLLERRPDATLKQLNQAGAAASLGARVDAALSAVRAYLAEVRAAQTALEGERTGAPGSVVARLGLGGVVPGAAVQQGPAQTSAAQAGAAPTGAAPTGAGPTGAAQTGAAQTGAAQVGAAQADSAPAGAPAQAERVEARSTHLADRARPFESALAELATTYGRVAHRLEALRLRVAADADAGTVANAAAALTGKAPAAPKDVVEVALEMTQAEQSAVSALTTLGAVPARIAEVVVQASAALARGEGDDEAMADVLRVMRQEMER